MPTMTAVVGRVKNFDIVAEKNYAAYVRVLSLVKQIHQEAKDPLVVRIADYILDRTMSATLVNTDNRVMIYDCMMEDDEVRVPVMFAENFDTGRLPIVFADEHLVWKSFSGEPVFAAYYQDLKLVALADPNEITDVMMAANLFHETHHFLSLEGEVECSDPTSMVELEIPAALLGAEIFSMLGGKKLSRYLERYVKKALKKKSLYDSLQWLNHHGSQYDWSLDHLFGEAKNELEKAWRMQQFITIHAFQKVCTSFGKDDLYFRGILSSLIRKEPIQIVH